MRNPRAPRATRPLAVALSYLCALAGLLPAAQPPARAAARAAGQEALAAEAHFVRRLSLNARDLVVDPATQTIYASVPSAAGAGGNSITPVDPAAGAVGAPVFVGSEPGKMSISDDGQYVYVALDGAAAVRRFDVATRTAGPQFTLGFGNFTSDGPFLARDLAVQPGSPSTLAVFRNPGFSSSGGVAAYDGGAARPAVVNSFDALSLAFSTSDPTRLYAFGGGSLRRMTVAAGGVTQVNATSLSGNGAVKFDNGRLYLSTGQVVDAESGGLLGTFTAPGLQGTTPFVPDSQKGRAYFLTAPFSSPGSPATLTLRAFDQQTFTPAGTLDIPGVLGSPTALVRWGANGLAFSTTAGELYLIQTTLVPSTEAVPTPTPTPATTPTPTPSPTPHPAFARQVALLANDIVYDPGTQKIYASVPSAAGAGGNSVTPVSTSDGALGTPTFVGSEPNRLARSDDGQYVYAALEGAPAVSRYRIDSGASDLRFALGTAGDGNAPTFAQDIEVMPGNPDAVAVTRNEGVSVYDAGVRRGTTLAGSFQSAAAIEFAAPDTLYAYYGTSSFDGGIRRLNVTPAGVTLAANIQGLANGLGPVFEYDAGRIYLGSGRVVDTATNAIAGTFQGFETGSLVVPDSSVGRTFFVGGAGQSDSSQNTPVVIRAYDQQTFLPVGTANVAGVRGRVRAAVRWGANGIAFCTTGGQLFLVQTSLVSDAEAAPSPTPTTTPTPVPTPTPAPTPAPGELRAVSLAANDLAVDPVTQKLYASVPSTAGAGGNSVAPIDPVAGTAGAPVFVGSEPTKLAVSDDGQYLYVGLDGAAAVRRVDIKTGPANPQPTAGLQFSLGTDSFGPLRVEDMEVAPGQPNVVAISLRRNGVSPRHGGVAVFDNGVKRPATTPDHTGSNVIEFSNSPSVLYGQNTETTEFGFRRMAVASCGVTTVRTTTNIFGGGFGSDFRVANNLAYATNGRVADPEAGVTAGLFSLFGQNSFPFSPTLVAPDPKAGRVYFLVSDNGFVLRVFDTKTFLKVGELRLPGVTGTPASLVRWGANGLAFRNGAGLVYLLQNALVGGADPAYSPAPAPPEPTFGATGKVNAFNNAAAGGVTIAVTGSLTTTTMTDAAGNFSLSGIPPCGSITVTPSKPNYVFNPASVTVTNLPFASNQLNFTASLKTFGFQLGVVGASESAGRVSLAVVRNFSAEAGSVSYETVSGTASDRSDFTTTLGTLNFAPGESFKTISVLLSDDALVEGPETFTVTLKDPVGAALDPNLSTLHFTIGDNDGSQSSMSPLENARFFVAQHYRDFLNRNAADDPTGFDFWTNQITACEANVDTQARANCLEDRRINVSAAFFLSIEFQETGYLVHRLYTASFPDSAARPRGLPRFREFLSDTQEMQRGVVVNVGNWQQQLESNKQAFVLAFVRRPEFVAAQPAALQAGEFVDRLFANAGATPAAAERDAAVAAFGAGGDAGRAAALRSVAESRSVFDRQFNSSFVLMQYFGYLRRAPNEVPDSDFSGYQFWLDKLNQFGNYRRAEMVKAFLVSLEYQQRFGPTTFDIRK